MELSQKLSEESFLGELENKIRVYKKLSGKASLSERISFRKSLC